jgi:peroxiredoxin
MNRTVLLVGVIIAAVLLGVLFLGLGKNPNEIRSPLIGRPAPAFALREVGTGRTVDLTQLKGTPVVLNFWATWCGPCKVEIPEFVELYSEYKDRGFVILGVLSQDEPAKDQLRAFLAENKMDYPVFYSNEKMETAFGELLGLPTSFLIGRDGSVCAKQLGPASKEDVERSLKALL